jgi:hypothetical protein
MLQFKSKSMTEVNTLQNNTKRGKLRAGAAGSCGKDTEGF